MRYVVPPAPVVPVVPEIVMPVTTPLITRVPLLRMLTCTVMAILVPEPLGPLRTSVSVPLTAPLPTGTLLACTWKLQVVKVMDFPASGPCVKEKVQEPKVVLPLDFVPSVVTLDVVGVSKVSVAGLLPILGSKIEPG